MVNLRDKKIYFPIINSVLSMNLDDQYSFHKDIALDVCSSLGGFPNLNTYFHTSSNEIQILSLIENYDNLYALHSANTTDAMFYSISDFNISKFITKYGTEHLESLFPNENYLVENFYSKFKFKPNNLIVSNTLIPRLGYMYSINNKLNCDPCEIMQFFLDLPNLEEEKIVF